MEKARPVACTKRNKRCAKAKKMITKCNEEMKDGEVETPLAFVELLPLF
jgi:hypothetical protein